uniref:Glycosyltransferase family 2 protein n=1 Tax=candidate division WOR-3 bacterium TaxID=2052148 RepID=A0A7C6A9I1_UNCW3
MLEIKVSVIVPAYNEAPNIEVLLKELSRILPNDYEVIIVDDGSEDGTLALACQGQRNYPWLQVASHNQNLGKTQAIITGAKIARGKILVIFDADLQFAPADILRLVEKIDEGADMCVGWKQGKYEKWLVSAVYNYLARKFFRLKIHDMNAVKAFKREIIDSLSLRKDWHRYLVPLAFDLGYRITEIPVKLYPRRFGRPKYQNPWRVVIGMFDLIAVAFQLTIMRKPMLYFGTYGAISIILGFVTGIIAIVLRILGHGFRPLLYLVILLVISGLLLFGFGLLGEAVATINDRLDRLIKKSQ